MLWSPGFGFAGTTGLGGGGSLGVGVVLRLAAQGLIESTAEARYDFSGFFSAAPVPVLVVGAIGFLLRPESHQEDEEDEVENEALRLPLDVEVEEVVGLNLAGRG